MFAYLPRDIPWAERPMMPPTLTDTPVRTCARAYEEAVRRVVRVQKLPEARRVAPAALPPDPAGQGVLLATASASRPQERPGVYPPTPGEQRQFMVAGGPSHVPACRVTAYVVYPPEPVHQRRHGGRGREKGGPLDDDFSGPYSLSSRLDMAEQGQRRVRRRGDGSPMSVAVGLQRRD